MRSLSNVFNLLAVGLTIAFLAIYVAHSSIVSSTDTALERSSRYDVAWVGAAGRMEVLSLQKLLANFMITSDQADASRVKLFAAILANRFSVFESHSYQIFLDRKPKRRVLIDTARQTFERILPDLNTIDELSDRQLELVQRDLEKVFAGIDRVGAEAQTDSVNQVAQIRSELTKKQDLQKWVASGLFGFIALMLAIAAIQNLFLRKANRKAVRSAEGFSYLAHHDSLTGLPNRMAFNTRFASALARCAEPHKGSIAVLAIDLDGFKAVNDRLGHATGDALLKQVAKRMSATCATFANSIITARIGGDDFAVVLDAAEGIDAVLEQADELRRVLSAPYGIDRVALVVGASVGVAVSVTERNPNKLLIDADIALTQAKTSGKDRVLLFDPAMHDKFLRTALIQSELAGAIENDEIKPHYQIKVDVATGRVTGAEVLARWNHPTLGPVSPAEFTRIAEQSDLIVPMGRKILEKACRDALHFPQEMGIAVNLSVVQFVRGDLVQTVREVLEATGFPAHRLTLEVTESLMISESDRAVEILTQLKDMGISIALDDFGTGYSALSYLRQFDWDELKIDRAFVMELETDDRAGAIVGSIVSMAHMLGIQVTAEGAETFEQIEILRDAGCDTIQGYHFGRPVPISDLPGTILHAVAATARLASNSAPSKNAVA
ncbi:bifunctional diguanylate cyclase/phosphodiesterase [uncultured Hoeflea sp.]|uniref:putative bifunctional diguanylate cyclase/phosphodiesterase n=1 Tax=uncultured Hoeflea sp. TaxID=538666 RepID=UPI0030DA0CAE